MLDMLLNMKALDFLQVVLNIPFKWFCNMKNLLGVFDQVKTFGKTSRKNISTDYIKSVHCTVILPTEGLKAVMRDLPAYSGENDHLIRPNSIARSGNSIRSFLLL
jgi:hypothetical protein